MNRSITLFCGICLIVAGCTGSNTNTPANDAGVTTNDTGVTTTDLGTSGGDSSVITSTSLPIATITNPSASGHPTNSSIVSFSDTNLVALSPRLFISQSTTSHKCLFAAWVGTSTGGANSAIEVIDSFAPPANPDGGVGDCFTAPANVIPDTLVVGQAITALTGQYEEYCPTGSTCPTGASAELSVGTGGVFTAGATGQTVPSPTVVHVTDVNGVGATPASMDVALQGSLVEIDGAMITNPTTFTSNHYNMTITDATSGSATMIVSVSKFSGVTCQRATLAAEAANANIGNVIGVLQFSFGSWVIQVVQASGLPSVACASLDGGVASDAGSASDM